MDIITKIKTRLLEVNDDDMTCAWNEGYLNALVDHEVINEVQYEGLMYWLKTGE